jgi:hypothetical protein
MRKIVQITATGVENTMGTQCDFMLVALCDDGTVWIKRGWSGDEIWYREPDIPQEAPHED